MRMMMMSFVMKLFLLVNMSGKQTSTPMTSSDASRIQSAGDKNPSSATATSGFAGRAQSAAAHQAAQGQQGKK